MHARSVAEDVKVWANNKPYSGNISIKAGKLAKNQDVSLSGNSLLHSAPLTTVAFTRS